MAATGNKRNYSILVGVELDTSGIQQQLNALTQKAINISLNVDGKDDLKDVIEGLKGLDKATKETGEGTKKASDGVQNMGLTFQQANDIMQKSVDIIGKMLDSVFDLDAALVEFQKVSELSGASLDAYVDKLTQMGLEVGRTGKP